MNFTPTPAQARIIAFLEEPIEENTPLMTRKQAADYLHISVKWLSMLSSNISPRGGRVRKVRKGGQVFYRKEDLDRYRSE